MKISALIIAGDEPDYVVPCLGSLWRWVNEVVSVADPLGGQHTMGVARRLAQEHREPEKLIVDKFGWCDDFAAARNHAASLASHDLHLWVDLDERLVQAQNLPAVVG